MGKTVIILGHPNMSESIANKIIVDEISEQEDVEVRDLTSLYPDFKIDVEAEQQALLEADTIVFQFPFYWYNAPGILRHWQDEVFVYGFAYGSTGDKLAGKNLIVSTTIGGPASSYQSTGFNTYTVEELLRPWYQSANLTGMVMQEPVISHDMVYIPNVYNTREEVEERARQHAGRLSETIQQCSGASLRRQVGDFVKRMFAKFDTLETPEVFLENISEDVQIQVPDGNFSGHQGFKDWYTPLAASLLAPTEHKVSKLSVVEYGDRIDARFKVTLSAKTRGGEQILKTFSEAWSLARPQEGEFKILKYRIS